MFPPLPSFKTEKKNKNKNPIFFSPGKVAPPRSASSMVIHHPGAGAAPASSVGDDDFHWDDAAEAELQAIEAAYASAKRRRLPDWTSPSPSSRPRYSQSPVSGGYSQSPVSGGSTPSWVLTPPSFQGAVPLFSATPFPILGIAELNNPLGS